ncbi:MAG: discoidin domain-containing protein [Candidatus Hydrogenedentes bacterium]|nr:discoidin domain-containing protein [Candidatus Hydrogenedentota bacterium]
MKVSWTLALGMAMLLAGGTPPAMAADEEMVEVQIDLPEAFFGGTPIEYYNPEHLEKEDYRDRPPFMAPKGTELVSAGKPVTGSDKSPSLGELKMLVDGDKNYAKNSLIELADGTQWVQIDLGAEHEIYAILLWHFHEGKRVYFDVVVQVANDAEFKDGVTTVHNNDYDNSSGLGAGKDMEYIENNKGRLVDAKGVKARYVRLYSNGNTSDDMNHYVEVEVFGRPAK